MATHPSYGCPHYKRKCKLVTPCCQKVYTCRFCHDEKENHNVNRNAITELICVICGNRQFVLPRCLSCRTTFGKYTCLACNLFDDEDKGQFHCGGCGLCRVGGWKNYYHCEKCNTCLSLELLDAHICVENVSRSECPVCLEDLHTSRTPLHYISNCGHLLHRPCFEDLEKGGHSACPLCKTAFGRAAQS